MDKMKKIEGDRLKRWFPVGKNYTSFGGTERFIQENIDSLKYGGMSFKNLRARLDEIEEEYGGEFEDLTVEVDTRSDFGDEIISVLVSGRRYETDKEYADRKKEASDVKAAAEARERQEYERLARKFREK